MKKSLICILFLFVSATLFAETQPDPESLSPEKFLDVAQGGHSVNNWGIMSGTAEHVRRGEDPIEVPLRVDVRFAVDRAIAKITINNNESFSIAQPYEKEGASVVSDDDTGAGATALGNIGLRPEDLTMSFLYWKLIKELPKASVMTFNCRVFELESPDHKETAIVYIHAKNYVAMKAEFIKAGEKEPYRTLTMDSFEKSGDLWTVSSFVITGPGWKTKVKFDSIKLGNIKDGIPRELFAKP